MSLEPCSQCTDRAGAVSRRGEAKGRVSLRFFQLVPGRSFNARKGDADWQKFPYHCSGTVGTAKQEFGTGWVGEGDVSRSPKTVMRVSEKRLPTLMGASCVLSRSGMWIFMKFLKQTRK